MKENKSRSSGILKMNINLQTVSTAICNDLNLCKVDYASYDERELKAFSKMKETLYGLVGESKANILIEEIDSFALTKFQIAFSLGMKAGATLQIKLINNIKESTLS